jgi:D,D-heptose 1,7-bisphosphate phosphatase
MPEKLNRAIFLDRDGCVISDENFLCEPERVRVLPGAAEAIRKLREAGYLVIVITNQSGVARGMLSEAKLAQIHARMIVDLAREGARLDDIYYCPHLPEGTVAAYAVECACRKPAPGMILRAAHEHKVDLAASYMIGDAERDIEAGLRAGCRAILLADDPKIPTQAQAVCADLPAAARLVLSAEGN